MMQVQTRLGLVVGAHPLTAEAGVEALEAGGNAADAAVAAAFTEAVVEPAHNGVAGYGGCAVVWQAAAGRAFAVDYNTRAPSAARPGQFPFEPTPDGGYVVPNGRPHAHGATAVGVPGVVAGLALIAERFGRLPLARLVQPAIRAARDGWVVNARTAEIIAEWAPVMTARFPETARLVMPAGRLTRTGETLTNSDLAATLEQLASQGAETFYRGELARRLVAGLREGGGLVTEEDFARYRARVIEPLAGPYRDLTLLTPPIPAGGGLTTLQMLRMLEDQPVGDFQPVSGAFYHLFAETMKVAWRERLTRYGDPDFVALDQPGELAEPLVAGLRARVRAGLARPSRGQVIAPEPGRCTSHLCAADVEGNVVSLTQTHGMGFGSLFTMPGTGLTFGHGLARFDVPPGRPNSLGPSKAPVHNMSPILALRAGRPYAAYGLPGGRTIPNNQAFLTFGLRDWGLSAADALALPRIHCDTVEPLQLEEQAPRSVAQELEALGHSVAWVVRNGGPGHIIRPGARAGTFEGATDPRSSGKVSWA